ncbi:MAG: peptidylprolyl isomerase [Paludibacteraceae bacterium]|nr:peptidylprolyl isomerase [Paludibacteraceae bacterium]
MKKALFIIALANTLFAAAQSNVIDEVIWVVGDEAILRSEVEEQRIRAQYEGTEFKDDPYCEIPEQLAIQKLFLHQGAIDSVEVSESSVASQVEMRLNYMMSQIGSKEKMEEYFHKNMTELREDLRDMVRNQMIIQQVQQQLVKDVKTTPSEIRQFYNNLSADSIPVIPTQVEVQIITIAPPVPQEEINRIKDRLREFTQRIQSGSTTFSMLARLYSEDTESAKHGGELGFMGRGQLVPEFANVAFALSDPNKVSRIVETEFGYHIIQLIEKRGDRMNFRHILLKPRISADDKSKAFAALDSLATQIRTGNVTFERAAGTFSQDKNSMMNGGVMTNEQNSTSKFEYQDLPQEVAKQVYGMKVGEISAPFSMIDKKTNQEVCAIVRLKSRTDTHKADLTNDYQVIKQYLENLRNDQTVNDWIRQKQQSTYIYISPNWRNCTFEYPGWVKE